MAGDKYYINDQHSTYFMTLTVIHWIDIFTRQLYRDIIIDSLSYCIERKGLVINAWVIMSNHMHLVCRCEQPYKLSDFLRDFKKFTSKKIIEAVHANPESRKEWLIDKFSFEARKNNRNKDFKFWQEGNHAIDLVSYNIDAMEKVNYIHNNPVRAGLVAEPDHYLYSSAIDYTLNGKGLLKVEVL